MRLKAIQTQTHMTTTTFSSPTTGRLPYPLPALAGAVVTGVSKHFGAHCLPVVLFLVLPPYTGGRENPEKPETKPRLRRTERKSKLLHGREL